MTSSRDTINDQHYFSSYDQFQVHELMLRDRPRVAAYHDAILNNKELFQNKVVLDVGSGTGILSMFAAKAGARLVYAVDACPTICGLAKELIKANHFEDRIQVMNKRVEEIENFPQQIDIIISEWMGFYLLHESMLESVIYARDHFLSKSSDPAQSILMFPSHAYLYCAPFVDQNIRIESNGMWKNFFDLNMTPILRHVKNSDLSECVIETIEPSQLVHDAQLIRSFDLRTVRIEDLRTMTSSFDLEIDNTCIISGFAFWFDCYFSANSNLPSTPTECLGTSPFSPATHWKQTLVFLPEDIYPLKGDTVPVSIRLKQSSENRRHYNLTVAIDNVAEEETSEQVLPRKRQRNGSSTTSSEPQAQEQNESEEENSDEDSSDDHPMPCSCDRPKCKLIKAIMEKFDEENLEE